MSEDQLIDSFPRTEEKILLCCAHTAPEAEKLPRLRELLASDLDWEYLLSRRQITGSVVFC